MKNLSSAVKPGFKEGLQSFNPRIKLNGTILDRRVILRDNIPGIEDFRNLKSQAPYFNIQ
jgi:hypothetical protein